MPFGLDPRRVVSIARQPILDPKARVFGHQLLYECGPSALDPVDTAAARTLSEAVLSIGIEPLACGRPLFITLTRSLLLGGAASLLPPSTVVVLDEGVSGDADVSRHVRATAGAELLDRGHATRTNRDDAGPAAVREIRAGRPAPNESGGLEGASPAS